MRHGVLLGEIATLPLLVDVGLGYVHTRPSVAARSRAGRVQRINLTTALGTSLVTRCSLG